MSKGKFQFDLWGVTPSDLWNWAPLRDKVAKHVMYNSLLVAPMPTASTSQILGNNECFEPYTSNLYVRRTLAGEFVCVSKHLLKDLIECNLWNPYMKNELIKANGSVQDIPEIPQDLKDLYKTVWEIKQKTIIDLAADRGAFICQSQSLNVHMSDITFGKLTSMHFYAWKKGLKTGMYYLRSKAAADAIQFTVVQNLNEGKVQATATEVNLSVVGEDGSSPKRHKQEKQQEEAIACSLLNRDECVSCGS
jgi:ribonucleoside-diphosphate reductase alpha chain